MSAVLGLATAVLVIWLLKILTKKPSVLSKIPAPKGLPVLGNTVQLLPGNAVHLKLSDWSKECGPVFRINFMGTEVVVVNGLKEIYEVLVSKGRHFAGRMNSFRANYITDDRSDVLALDYGSDQIYRRKLLMGHLTQYGQGIGKQEEATRVVCRKMIDGFLAHKNEAIPIENALQNSWFDFCYNLVHGEGLDDTQERVDIIKVLQYAEKNISLSSNGVWLDVFPWLRSFGNKTYRALQDMKCIQRRVSAKWRQRAETNQNPHSFIFNLLLTKQGSNEFKLTDENVDSLAWDLVFGSMLPTVATFSSLVNILSQKPEIQQKLQQEIDRTLGKSEEVKFNNKDNLPYCYATILEALRYTSVLPLGIPHKALEDSSISNYNIPKGTGVLCNLWALHHDETIWDDPFEFQPQRFLIKGTGKKTEDGNEDTGDLKEQSKQAGKAHNTEISQNQADNNQKPRTLAVADNFHLVPTDHPLRQALLPFGAGTRVCSGEMIALMQMFTMLVTMMQRTDILPERDGEEQPSCDPRNMTLGATLKPQGFKVRFVARV